MNRDEGEDGRCIREYYACFNERRFADAAALFAEDALVQQMPLQRTERGGAAYVQFAETWTRAFPDATITIERLTRSADCVYEVDLFAVATHNGPLDLGGSIAFKPTGAHVELHLREVLEFRGHRIAASCVSFDFQEMVQQLVRVDETRLLAHLSRVRQLEDQLRALPQDVMRRRELVNRLGFELDAARQVVRPYFQR